MSPLSKGNPKDRGFGASVTMDMTEKTQQLPNHNFRSVNVYNLQLPESSLSMEHTDVDINEQKKILFKCVDSQFFSEFDGEWAVSWTTDPDDPSKLATKIQYIVDVRPKGPVPVQALEWRIREDVPTNLRAVKAASMELGKDGVLALRDSQRAGRNGNVAGLARHSRNTLDGSNQNQGLGQPRDIRPTLDIVSSGRMANVSNTGAGRFRSRRNGASESGTSVAQKKVSKLAPVRVQWYEDETMAKYLKTRSASRR